MSETGYNSDLEEVVKNTFNTTPKKQLRKRKRKGKSTLKKTNFKTKTKKQVNNPTVPVEYKDSIYYSTKNFDTITKHILDSDLLDNGNNTNTMIDKEFNKVMLEKTSDSSKQQASSKQVSISVSKTVIDGKKHEEVKITENNSSLPYIKEYTYINGKKTVSKIKK